MKKFLVASLCFSLVVMVWVSVWAVDINERDFKGLSDEQKAQIATQIAEMKKKKDEIPTAEKVNQWVDVGKNVGVALAATAKEIGVAADQFLKSTTGKITVALIVWKVLGRDLMHYVIGFCMFFFFVPWWIYFFRRMCIIKTIRIEYPKESFRKVKHYEYYGEGDCDGTRWAMFIVLALLLILCTIVTFT